MESKGTLGAFAFINLLDMKTMITSGSIALFLFAQRYSALKAMFCRNSLPLVFFACLIGSANSMLHAEEADTALNPPQPSTTSSGNIGKELHNPLAHLKEIIFQLDVLPDEGPDEKGAYNLSLQPVYPFRLPNDWRLVTYSIIPLVSQPGLQPGEGRTNGIGDTQFFGYFVPPNESGLLWGFGPAAQLPTHTDDALGNDEWALGPALIVGAEPGNWSVWGLFDNIWSVGGSGEDINDFNFQYQVVYMLPKDWFLISNWTIDADWEASGDDRWTIPIGGGFGKQFKIGDSQFQLYGQLGYNVEAPDEASTWRGILALTKVF